jgi:hypothetical protein
MLLPQSWDGHHLVANLLLLPNGDPTAPVSFGSEQELPFATAQPVLRAALLPGLETPPWDPSITPAMLTTISLTLTYSAAQKAIFSALNSQYAPNIPVLTQPDGAIYKDLPPSYREATGFQTPVSDIFTTGDGYRCSLGSTASKPKKTPVPSRTIAWGEILSYALRQPLIAQAMGLIYSQVSIPLDPAQVANGGWIWLEIDSSDTSNWYAKLVTANAAAVSTYAARLPAMTAAQDVFAAVLFPTVPFNYASSWLDAAQNEADIYLDGFAKVVHANQPTSCDAATGDSTQIVPGTDAGIQIGWDDERVTNWINRQVQIAQSLASPTPPATPLPELPFTILGYRVDVREKDSDPWASLCAASGTLNAAGVFSTSFSAQDLCVEPTPVQNGTGDYWLPQYFAQWRGRTLVVNDKYAYTFSGGQPPASTPPADSEFTGTTAEALSGVNLRYGQSYQFRTRLADLTGGGPEPTDPSPSDAGATSLNFRRYVPPKKVQFTAPTTDASGNQILTVDRPLINYPEMVFTGAADQGVLDDLLSKTPAQPPTGSRPTAFPAPFQAAVLDPDVVTLEVIVEAQAPTYDTGTTPSLADADTTPAPGDLDGKFRVVYTWPIDFPAITKPVVVGTSTPIQLTLQPTVMNQIDNPVLPSASQPTVLPIPTGRNVRLRLRGLGTPDANNDYFGSSIARTGLISDLRLRFEAATETGVIKEGSLDEQLQAFYLRDLDQSGQQQIVSRAVLDAIAGGGKKWALQSYRNLESTLNPPASTPIQMLASALDLQVNGLTLSAAPGQRILFGAQSSLRHTLPQDRSSITFSSHKDLINHWIVVQQLTLDRDWTWSGLAQNGAGQIAFTFMGATVPAPNEVAPKHPHLKYSALGQVTLPGVVSSLATQQGALDQRDTTTIVFFSTIDSTVGPKEFPTPIESYYQLMATLTGNPTQQVQLWNGDLMVPITAQPRQIPQLVSAGIAESPFIVADDYSSTAQRQRALWLEFDQPPLDANDSYFLRVINYGPDPLLISHPSDLPSSPDTPIALDPEPIRVITHDSANDDAGLAAMTRLIPSSTSKVHFLVPLPDGISPSALDLFGFWTYELRCGHLQWSTAQGRFGRPFRLAGVQHPCPPLTVNVERIHAIPAGGKLKQPCIGATADLAQTVLDGQSLTSMTNPQTQIWFLLYAQLRRADGEAYRNLLLGKLQGIPPNRDIPRKSAFLAQQQSIPVTAAFPQAQIDDILNALKLPGNTPLSVLAVELFNRESLVIREENFSAEVLDELAENTTASAQQNSFSSAVLQAPPASEATASSEDATLARAETEIINDPLGQALGSQRILRVSPLTPVRVVC